MIIDMDRGPVFANTGGALFDPSKPTAILVHGAGGDHSIWGGQNRYLAHHGASVLAIDLPAHGRTGGKAIDSISGLAEFLIDFIAAAKVETPILIGHSMGALTSLEAASRLGKGCAGLGLCGVAGAMPVHPDLLGAAQRNELTAAQFIASWGHGSRAHRGGNPTHGVWLLNQAVTLINRTGPGVLYTDLKACNEYKGALDAAAKVVCPTQFLLGQSDKMTPLKAAQPLIDAVADAQVTVLPAIGHMMTVEAPTESCSALMALMGRVQMA
ncbi:MAG: alpha/beta hydrolase [Alphaproteobacteria bacterium]|nr:alpha/beta hydrolase [Alphaproteobacteria bacterium]